MTDFLIASLAIACMLIVWIGVQRLAYSFARKHPEFGPPREEGGGCGSCTSEKRGCASG